MPLPSAEQSLLMCMMQDYPLDEVAFSFAEVCI
jgi:hypothetical protein